MTLLCTLILVFFSERLFWTVFLPGDSLGDQLMTILAYMAPTYLFIAMTKYFNAHNFSRVFFCGIVFGWLVEGGLTHTMYGTQDSAPFPLSILCTSVSWHALISATLGWYFIPKFLQDGKEKELKKLSIGLGFFWGIWAMFLWQETPAIVASIPEFTIQAFFITALLTGSYRLLKSKKIHEFKPGKTGLFLSIVLLGIFFSEHVKNLGARPIYILFPLIAAVFFLLKITQRYESIGEQEVNKKNLKYLFYMPLAASITYTLMTVLNFGWVPIAKIVFYWVTVPLGIILLIFAAYQLFRKSNNLPATGP